MRVNIGLKHFIPSIIDTVIIIITVGILYVTSGAIVLIDGDTGYHLRTGHYILNNLTLPSYDFYSYTCYGKPWVAFSWGNDVIFALFDKIGQINGVVFLALMLILSFIVISYLLMVRWKINLLITIVMLLVITTITSVHWLARPHLFTALFTAIFFYLMELGKENKKIYFFIPILMLIWTNIHPGFLSGVFILTIYLIGNLVEYFIYNKDKVIKENLKYISCIYFLSLAATLINPYGLLLHDYIHKTLTSYWIVNATSEYFSPNFHGMMAVLCYEGLLFAFIAFGMLKKQRVLDLSQVLLIVFWSHLSLFAIRNIVLFALITGPLLAKVINQIIIDYDLKILLLLGNKLQKSENIFRYHFWPILVLLISFAIVLNKGDLFDNKIINCQFPKEKLPVLAMEYIANHPIKGNLLNQDNWGGYIIYKYPDTKVFMDGRLDMYQEKFLDMYQKIIYVQPGWKEIINKYKIKWILFNNNTVFCNLLLMNSEWKVYYRDKLSTIFIKKEKSK